MQNWIVYGLLSAVFAALVAIFGKMGMTKIDSTLATTLRSIVMAVLLTLFSLRLGKFANLNTLDTKAIIFIVLSGLAGATSWLFYFWALKNGPTTAVAVLDRLSLIFIAILAFLLLGESLTWRSILAVLLMLASSILILQH